MRADARPVISCEHASNAIPARWQHLFNGSEAVLASHRGWDIGAAELARHLAGVLSADCFLADASRLLMDLNRSRHHPQLFSGFTRPLPAQVRGEILARHYTPYREQVTAAIRARTALGARVLHLSVHSFTPVLDGAVRNADVGLLYDPSRTRERAFAQAWETALKDADPALRVRRNYPYRGTADGFATALRRTLDEKCYTGFELEVNQALASGPQARWRALQASLARSLRQACEATPTLSTPT